MAQRGREGMVVACLLLGLSACGVASGGRSAAVDVAASAAAGGPVVATVTLPDYGTDVAAGADGRVYVTVPSGKVIVVDPVAAVLAATVAVDGEPHGIAVAPDGRRAWVADLLGRQVTVIDTAGARVQTTIPVGTLQRPSLRPSAAVSRDGAAVYVGDTARDHLLFIDTAASRITRDLFLDIHPADVGVAPDGATVWVAGCRLSCIDGTLLAVDTASGKVARRLPLASVPTEMVLTPDGRRAYVAHGREASVSSVDLASGTATPINLRPEPAGIALSPDGRFAYVTSFQAGTLQVIATATDDPVVALPVGRSPRAVAVSPDGRRAYVTHSTSLLSIVDLTAGSAR